MSAFLIELFRAVMDPGSGFSKSVTEDIDGTVLERLEYIANRSSLGGGLKVSGSGYLVYPSAASGVDPANAGSAWNNGSYSEVVASTAQANYVFGLAFSVQATNTGVIEGEIDIATGAGGGEVVVSTVPYAVDLAISDGFGHIVLLPYPIAVATSTRIAVRQRASSTSIEAQNVKLMYVKQSELVAL